MLSNSPSKLPDKQRMDFKLKNQLHLWNKMINVFVLCILFVTEHHLYAVATLNVINISFTFKGNKTDTTSVCVLNEARAALSMNKPAN